MKVDNSFLTRAFWVTVAITAVWVHVSEVFRYFMFVMPMMREAMSVVPDVAPMNIRVFMLWFIWDTVWVLALCGFIWLWVERFDDSLKSFIAAATLIWLAVFVVLWLGMLNMNLTTYAIAAVALPLAWLEAVVGALIVRWGRRKFA